MSRLVLFVVFGLSVSGASCDNDPCNVTQGGLDNALHPTGSQTVAVSSDAQFMVATNASENSITLVRSSDLSRLDRLEVGATPERVAPVGDSFVVTLRGERGIAKVSIENNRLRVINRVDTGAEPIGIVASEDGAKVYVAVSQSGMVEERDGVTLELVRSFPIANEPRWVALHPSGQTLYVATGMGGHVHVVDLINGSSKELELPSVTVFAEDEGFQPTDRARRITGDLAVRSNGRELLIPALYIDNLNTIEGSPEPNEEASGDGYGNSGSGKRFIAAVATVQVDASGKPTGDGKVQELEAMHHSGEMRGGYISSLAVHPTQDLGFATMEASDTMIAFDLSSTSDKCTYGTPGDQGGGGFSTRPSMDMAMPEPMGQHVGRVDQRGFGTQRGPSGIAFSGNVAVVHSRLARTLESVAVGEMAPRDQDHHDIGSWNNSQAVQTSALEDSKLDARVQTGLGIFFSNLNPEVSGHNINVSCSSCHFDGRNDGLTWTFSDGARQTPSLAGNVSLTEPVTWRDDVATVGDEVRLTSQGRMGGAGLSGATQAAVTDYVNWRPHVDLPNKGMDNAIIAEGREIFMSETAACSTCHTGEQFTDSEMHRVRGLDVRTPTLRGIAATAPYFHNGSSSTLREVLERSRDGSMGNTRDLSEAQMQALEAYLTSL